MASAKGWAGSILFNETLLSQFTRFKNRKDTFSLGVCNGCQLMALLGWVNIYFVLNKNNITIIIIIIIIITITYYKKTKKTFHSCFTYYVFPTLFNLFP